MNCENDDWSTYGLADEWWWLVGYHNNNKLDECLILLYQEVDCVTGIGEAKQSIRGMWKGNRSKVFMS